MANERTGAGGAEASRATRAAYRAGAGGGTVLPEYRVRQPVMYHLFETEMESISAFNAGALTCFSIGSFFLTLALNILIANGFATGKLSDIAILLNKLVMPSSFGLAAVIFLLGWFFLRRKNQLIDRIKTESRSNVQ